MKKSVLFLTIFLFALTGCNKNVTEDNEIVEEIKLTLCSSKNVTSFIYHNGNKITSEDLTISYNMGTITKANEAVEKLKEEHKYDDEVKKIYRDNTTAIYESELIYDYSIPNTYTYLERIEKYENDGLKCKEY